MGWSASLKRAHPDRQPDLQRNAAIDGAGNYTVARKSAGLPGYVLRGHIGLGQHHCGLRREQLGEQPGHQVRQVEETDHS